MTMDRLKEINEELRCFVPNGVQETNVQVDITWLTQEIERLRRIEDVARSTNHCVCEFPDDLGACQEQFEMLCNVLEANPRPEGAGE